LTLKSQDNLIFLHGEGLHQV